MPASSLVSPSCQHGISAMASIHQTEETPERSISQLSGPEKLTGVAEMSLYMAKRNSSKTPSHRTLGGYFDISLECRLSKMCWFLFLFLSFSTMSDREVTSWQHNRIYPQPISLCEYKNDLICYLQISI